MQREVKKKQIRLSKHVEHCEGGDEPIDVQSKKKFSDFGAQIRRLMGIK